jgi:hypothetical protein
MRCTLFIQFLLIIPAFTFAQAETVQIKLHTSLAVPHGIEKTGIGLYAKVEKKLGHNGSFTATTGLTGFPNGWAIIDEFSSRQQSVINMIPFMLGYKRNWNSFYLEPQVGYGQMKVQNFSQFGWYKFNRGAIMFGAGIGYEKNKWDLGLRYHAAKMEEIYDLFDFAKLHIGYTLWSNERK